MTIEGKAILILYKLFYQSLFYMLHIFYQLMLRNNPNQMIYVDLECKTGQHPKNSKLFSGFFQRIFVFGLQIGYFGLQNNFRKVNFVDFSKIFQYLCTNLIKRENRFRLRSAKLTSSLDKAKVVSVDQSAALERPLCFTFLNSRFVLHF